MEINVNILKKIEKYGKCYSKDLGKKEEYKEIGKSFEFLFERIFKQGRSNDLASDVKKNFLKRIKPFIGENYENFKEFFEKKLFKKINFDNIDKARNKSGKDKEMVLDLFEKIASYEELKNYNYDFMEYTKDEIKKGNIDKVYNFLIKIKGIGPKISSFYLRDIITLYELEKKLSEEDYFYVQPIDTWVKKIAIKIRIIKETDKKDKIIREKIKNICLKNKINPIKFNQGAWYIGFNAFDIIIQNYLPFEIDKINCIKKNKNSKD